MLTPHCAFPTMTLPVQERDTEASQSGWYHTAAAWEAEGSLGVLPGPEHCEGLGLSDLQQT